MYLNYIFNWLPCDVYRKYHKAANLNMENYDHDIYTPLKISMITFSANLKNVWLDEKCDINNMVPTGNIRCINSNFGVKYRDGYIPELPKVKKSNKGRKPKEKKIISKRQRQGKLMHTQTTFEIESNMFAGKIYKCRVFRTGGLNIPGVLLDDLSDITDIIEELVDFFKKHFNNDDIECIGIDDPMNGTCTPLRNYTSSFLIEENDVGINIRKLYNQLQIETHRDDIDDILPLDDKGCSNLTIKFRRPTLTKSDAASTLKISRKKLRLEGFKKRNDADDIYNWINNYIKKYYNIVVYDTLLQYESESSDTDDYISMENSIESIYEKKIDIELTNLMEDLSILQ